MKIRVVEGSFWRLRFRILAAFLAALLAIMGCGIALAADGVPEAPGVSAEEEGVQQGAGRPVPVLDPSSVSAQYAILMEATTGRTLFEKNADEKAAPASVTKIMSLLLIMEAIERGEVKLDDQVACSEHAAGMGGSQIWLEPGEVMTVDELLKAVAVGSANDATVALAEFVAGSEDSFVSMMNERAGQLGMVNTAFKNSSGLDEEGHFTSVRDTALVSAELVKHPLIINYSTIWMDTLRGGATALSNTNRLVRFYSGITGLKTGTTNKAGKCVSATAERDGFKLVAVVFNAPTSESRFADARMLLDYGYANYTVVKPPLPQEDIFVPVTRGEAERVLLRTSGVSDIILQKGLSGELELEIILPDSVSAPIEEGMKIGEAVVRDENGEQVGVYALEAAEAVGKLTFWRALGKIFERICTMW